MDAPEAGNVTSAGKFSSTLRKGGKNKSPRAANRPPARMNRRAEELGCVNTHFANAHGLHDENHYTCAYDVYLIAREVEKHARLVEIVAMQKATIHATNL